MNYSEAANYLFGLQKFGWKLGLDRMRHLLAELGHPERSMRFVHVAGTNGKGSVAAMLASIIHYAGYRTGLYTSPHIVDVRERIQVAGEMIPETEFAVLTKSLQPYLDKLGCTFFEAMTALALMYFVKSSVKIAILEVGLGGRLDATNVVMPELCVITNIGFDHTEHLGRSLEQIAAEKAGILKQGVPCVLGEMPAKAGNKIRNLAAKVASKIFIAKNKCDVSIIEENVYGSRFHIKIEDFIDGLIEIPLAGKHQIENAVTAVNACFILSQKGFGIPGSVLKEGLKNVSWPARFQVISQSPFIIADVAHNVDSMKKMTDSLTTFFKDRKLIFVFGLLKDKKYKEIVKLIAPLAYNVIIVQPETPRALEKEKIAAELAGINLKFTIANSVGRGIERALEMYQNNSVICITGSHYVVGEALVKIKYLTGNDNMFKFNKII